MPSREGGQNRYGMTECSLCERKVPYHLKTGALYKHRTVSTSVGDWCVGSGAKPELTKRVHGAMGRLREIHERYTPEAISERLGRQGCTDLETAVKTETEQMLTEYRQAEAEFGLPPDFAMEHLEGATRLPGVIGNLLEGSRRTGKPLAPIGDHPLP